MQSKRIMVLAFLLGAQVATSAHAGLEQAGIFLIPADGKTVKQVGPYFRLGVPNFVYPTSLSPQLSELRIRNAAGDFLPYAWVDAENKPAPIISMQLPIFPIRSQAGQENATILSIKQNPDGSLSKVGEIRLAQQAPISAWIVDASRLQGRSHLLQARFSLSTETEGVAALRLEGSDDLQHWQSISHNEQLVQLKHQGASVQKLDLNLQQSRAKYLRISWKDVSKALAIMGVIVDSQEQVFSVPSLEWSATIKASRCEKLACEYTLPEKTPVDSLRLQLNEINILSPVNIEGKIVVASNEYHHHHRNPLYVLRHQKRMAEVSNQREMYLGEITAYRLRVGNDEISSGEIAMNGLPYSSLKLRTSGAITVLGSVPPTIQVGTLARNLIFLARGAPPYRMEWGSAASDGAAIALSTLMPHIDIQQVVAVGEARVEPRSSVTNATVESKAPASVPKKTNQVWLWAALSVGLLLLGAMVWSLLGNLNKAKTKETQID
jgi:hypothetical protein